MARLRFPAMIVLALLVLAGCNLPNRVDEEDVGLGALTLAVQTVQAQLTLDAANIGATQETPVTGGQPTITLAPSATLEPTDIPDDVICDEATFIADVTVPDGEQMLPGEAFTKTWRLQNLGAGNQGKDRARGPSRCFCRSGCADGRRRLQGFLADAQRYGRDFHR